MAGGKKIEEQNKTDRQSILGIEEIVQIFLCEFYGVVPELLCSVIYPLEFYSC